MRTVFGLAMATLLCVSNALADPASEEVRAPGQPFEHPSGDVSYAKDMGEDEVLAKSTPAANGQVLYISGGVGESSMRAIDKEESIYNLKVLFVGKNGEYLSDVSTKISDSKGSVVLDTTTKGPVLLVKMPRGRYIVETEGASGFELTRHVEVSNDHLSSYVFRFPAKEQ